MKKKIDWFLNGTYLWHAFIAAAVFGWGLMFEHLSFMKGIGATFIVMAIISGFYSYFSSQKKGKK